MTDLELPYSHTDIDGRSFYHGTKAELKPADMLQGGYSSNYTERRPSWSSEEYGGHNGRDHADMFRVWRSAARQLSGDPFYDLLAPAK